MNKENYQLSREDWKLSKIFRYQLLAIACCVLAIAFSVPAVAARPLEPISLNQLQAGESENLAFDAQIWGENGKPGDRQLLLRSIDNSLRYLDTSAAATAYSRYPVAELRAIEFGVPSIDSAN
jgi:membrane-bound lytic murein transglycosylase A